MLGELFDDAKKKKEEKAEAEKAKKDDKKDSKDDDKKDDDDKEKDVEEKDVNGRAAALSNAKGGSKKDKKAAKKKKLSPKEEAKVKELEMNIDAINMLVKQQRESLAQFANWTKGELLFCLCCVCVVVCCGWLLWLLCVKGGLYVARVSLGGLYLCSKVLIFKIVRVDCWFVLGFVLWLPVCMCAVHECSLLIYTYLGSPTKIPSSYSTFFPPQ